MSRESSLSSVIPLRTPSFVSPMHSQDSRLSVLSSVRVSKARRPSAVTPKQQSKESEVRLGHRWSCPRPLSVICLQCEI